MALASLHANECEKDEERIAIADLADLQVRKQRIFKILPRLNIVTTQRREAARGNQLIAMVTATEARVIRDELERSGSANGSREQGRQGLQLTDDIGFFCLIQLEPELDGARFKVGSTMDLDGRLQKHRCSAPFAAYVKSWPCLRAWERTAMDCATTACERPQTEVFRARELVKVLDRAERFFSLMPTVRLMDDEDGEPGNLGEAG